MSEREIERVGRDAYQVVCYKPPYMVILYCPHDGCLFFCSSAVIHERQCILNQGQNVLFESEVVKTLLKVLL